MQFKIYIYSKTQLSNLFLQRISYRFLLVSTLIIRIPSIFSPTLKSNRTLEIARPVMTPFHIANLCAFTCLVILVLLTIWIDWQQQIIPNEISLGLLSCGLAYGAFVPHLPWSALIGGVAAGAGSLGILAAIFRLCRGHDGLGIGDIKLAAAAGAWVGWEGLAPLLVLASSMALLTAMSKRIYSGQEITLSTRLPFGPFIGTALIIVWSVQTSGIVFSPGLL